MKFEINFNRVNDDKTLEELGAILVPIPYAVEYPQFDIYEIELNTFEELEELLSKVKSIKKDYYSAVLSFDPPCIFLDELC